MLSHFLSCDRAEIISLFQAPSAVLYYTACERSDGGRDTAHGEQNNQRGQLLTRGCHNKKRALQFDGSCFVDRLRKARHVFDLYIILNKVHRQANSRDLKQLEYRDSDPTQIDTTSEG